MKSPATAPPATDAAARLRLVIAQLGRTLRLLHSGTGLSPSQHEVLGTIVRQGPLRVSEVAALEGLNPTMLSRIAAKLEGANLVQRTQDPDDGRIAYLSPTTAGRALYEQIRTQRTDALLVAIGKLSKDEQQALGTALPVLESLVLALRRPPS